MDAPGGEGGLKREEDLRMSWGVSCD